MNNLEYYGITIGPIFDTINLTSSPGGLWVASFLFSNITKKLVNELEQAGMDVLLPTSSDNQNESQVGSYPDHIIFAGNIEGSTINSIILKVKKEIADLLIESYSNGLDKPINNKEQIKQYIIDYLNIHCVKVGNLINQNNIVTTVSEYLDNIELSKNYIHQDNDSFFLNFFSGTSDDRNVFIRNFINNIGKENIKSQVIKKDKGIKSIDDIAFVKESKNNKVSEYYAIVYSDGDNMSSNFELLDSTKDIKDFSKACIQYTNSCANIIGEYGGVTIYAGGDDLLFLAPLVNKNKDTIFDLCNEINKNFQNIIKTAFEYFKKISDQKDKKDNNDQQETKDKESTKEIKVPTVSFGMAITYKKFPIYEGLELARDMLFTYAKQGDKNNLAIRLSKSSGQSVAMIFSNNSSSLDKFKQLLKSYFINDNSDSSRNRVNSVIYLIEKNEKLFNTALKQNEDAVIRNFFVNMYDNPNQKGFTEFINEIIELYKAINSDKITRKYVPIDDESNDKMSGILRLAKFYIEKKEANANGN
ncbi:type III-B CRISPR-associated protein Cas10/Cmr2 [Thomasclavelia sp.]|uniref:Cas10/Cmr2 second palm domain-containing protein n=1 Tax=Thomasclavelia sp. TaxID=3025757 RepID=UPI0025CFE0FC|nr:type III-B CRISPR-associated protein Cas10/Cmr2 [Thomasclavelia sp.]